jgi:hypothetical protein
MEMKLTRKFPTKDGIYLVQTKKNNFNDEDFDEPFLAEIHTEDFPEVYVKPTPCHNHNDCFCLTKGNNNAKFFGPIKFVN